MRRAVLASALAALSRVRARSPARGATASAQRRAGLLAATPYMGWDTYFALPGGFPETTILQEADRLKTTGLEALGYRLIWLDAGWWQGQRDAAAQIVVSPTQWPHGIAWLALDAPRERLPARRLHRRRLDRLRRQGRHVRSLPAGRQHVRVVGRRRDQGRLVRRRGAGARPGDPVRADPPGDPRQREPPPDAAQHLQLPPAGPGPDRPELRRCPRSPRTRSARRRATAGAPTPTSACPATSSFSSVLRNLDADATADRGRRARATGTTPTTSRPTRA